ncbi:MAG TPA: CoA transferase [Candidatus Binataceae bacterium]|nr:CoA transferase [Candidatus Binataceae bacterium]
MTTPLPLDDLRVLDLTHFYNGPYATMLLSYLGADVIKIEGPPYGDGMRPLYKAEGKPFGIPFALMNSNKRAVTLNLKSDEGKAIFKKLVAKTDIVVENYAAGTMDSMGLGWDELRAINPRLIYASGTGYGLSGPNRSLPAFDPVVQANTGIMALTGATDGPPYKAGPAVVDILGSAHLFGGILAAVRQRDRTGQGQMVELSLQESTLPSLSTHIGAWYGMGMRNLRDGNHSSGSFVVPFNAYPALDGWVMILAGDNLRWSKLCSLMGHPEFADDPRFAKASTRRKHQEIIDNIIAEWTRTLTRQQIMDLLAAKDLFGGIVKEIDEVMTDPHLHERGTLREIDHPQLGRMTIFTSPIRLNGEPNVPRSPAPMIGRDNDDFYAKELGLSADEIAALRDRKVI